MVYFFIFIRLTYLLVFLVTDAFEIFKSCFLPVVYFYLSSYNSLKVLCFLSNYFLLADFCYINGDFVDRSCDFVNRNCDLVNLVDRNDDFLFLLSFLVWNLTFLFIFFFL